MCEGPAGFPGNFPRRLQLITVFIMILRQTPLRDIRSEGVKTVVIQTLATWPEPAGGAQSASTCRRGHHHTLDGTVKIINF